MPERIEQHIGTILQVMVIGLLAWSLSTTVSLRTDVGILQVQISTVNGTLAQAVNDRYVVAAIRSDMANLERRVGICEATK